MSLKIQLRKIVKSLRQKSESVENMAKIGNLAKDIIIDRTQNNGKIVKGGTLQQNPPLAPSTIAKRLRSKLSSKTTPTTSNLTETGEMLDSLTVTATAKKVKVGPSGNKNRNKVKYVSLMRPFLKLSKSELKRITLFIRNSLTK